MDYGSGQTFGVWNYVRPLLFERYCEEFYVILHK
jgi:hypothetical protein